MIKSVTMLIVACFFATAGFSARARIEWRTYVQPDGQVLTLTLSGDEHFHCYKDVKGNMYTRDEEGVFHLMSPEEIQIQEEIIYTRSSLPLPATIHTDWDPDRIYRQLVVLVSFSDCEFSMEDPQATYNAMFNERGYNQRVGPGCVADYFRDQSEGRLNIQFDVYGPVKVSSSVKQLGSIRKISAKTVCQEAAQKLIEQYPEMDFSVYDWYGEKKVTQVIFVYAGYAGNDAGYEYTWPTTGYFSAVTTPDDYNITHYSASGELWYNNTSCGIGTICHEFTHCLGLPDVYMAATSYPIVDEWDLMDGGPNTNRGWCPPNYSPLEKMLLGWLTPVELTKDTVITGLKPVAEGGDAYIINHTDVEFYLIENRQWKGWDLGLPGQGLLVYHVLYDKNAWGNNKINNRKGYPYYSIVAADNLSYDDWFDLIIGRGLKSPYVNKNERLNSMILSSAAYPWQTDSTSFVNNALSNISVPTTEMYTANEKGDTILSKSISDITQHDDGTVSFVFHGSIPDGVSAPRTTTAETSPIYTLQGSRIAVPRRGSLYIRNGRKYIAR